MRTIVTLALFLLVVSCGPNHGTAIQKDTARGSVTIHYTEAVDAALAGKVFDAMIDGSYHFGENLAVQLDKVDGRLTLRTCHDNEDSIQDVIKEGENSGVVSYTRGLAWHISKAIDNQEVDVVMCRLKLADPFYTLKWKVPE